MKKLSASSHGFTLTELMVSMAIAAIICTLMMTVTLTLYGTAIRSQVTAQMAVETQFMLRSIVEDVRLADSIGLISLLPDANAPSGGWQTSNTNKVLIINQPAVTSSNDIIYDPLTGNPYDNEYIYFLSGRTLYKRSLKNPLATASTTKTSCPSALVTSACPVDKQYSQNVDSITLTFYDLLNNETTVPTLAKSVKISVSTSRKVFGKNVTFNNTVLTKLRN